MNKLYEESAVQDIANAIREKNGSTTLYKIGDMGAAIRAIDAGGSLNVVRSTATPENPAEGTIWLVTATEGDVYVQTAAPSAPKNGDVWFTHGAAPVTLEVIKNVYIYLGCASIYENGIWNFVDFEIYINGAWKNSHVNIFSDGAYGDLFKNVGTFSAAWSGAGSGIDVDPPKIIGKDLSVSANSYAVNNGSGYTVVADKTNLTNFNAAPYTYIIIKTHNLIGGDALLGLYKQQSDSGYVYNLVGTTIPADNASAVRTTVRLIDKDIGVPALLMRQPNKISAPLSAKISEWFLV